MSDLFNLVRAGQDILKKVLPDSKINRSVSTIIRNYDEKVVSEPQRAYQWEVSFQDPFGDVGERVKYYAKATGVPASMNDNIKRRYAGREYSYPGVNNSPRIYRITVWDNQSMEIYKFFDRWLTLTQFSSGNLKVNPENYMRDITLSLMDVSGTLNTQTFILMGAYPTEISEATLSYGESGEIMFDIMFYYTEKILL